MSFAATSSGDRTTGLARPIGWMAAAFVAASVATVALHQTEVSFLTALDEAANAGKSQLLLAASVEDIITEDRSRLETTVSQIQQTDAQFYGYKVADEDGTAMLSWQQSNAPQQQQVLMFLNRDYPIQRSVNPIVFEGETYGTVTVEWDQSVNGARRDNHAYFLAGTVAILCLGFGFFGYLVGREHA